MELENSPKKRKLILKEVNEFVEACQPKVKSSNISLLA
jgi:hypothetical protein